MAISEQVILPAEPAAGSLQFIPLAGNGYQSPQSAFLLNMQITGDASAGRIRFIVARDARFEQITQFMSIESNSATAIDYNMQYFRAGVGITNAGKTEISSVDSAVIAHKMWVPPAVMNCTKWECSVDNVDLEVHKFKLLIYNFRVDASKVTPLSLLFSSLTRTGSAL